MKFINSYCAVRCNAMNAVTEITSVKDESCKLNRRNGKKSIGFRFISVEIARQKPNYITHHCKLPVKFGERNTLHYRKIYSANSYYSSLLSSVLLANQHIYRQIVYSVNENTFLQTLMCGTSIAHIKPRRSPCHLSALPYQFVLPMFCVRTAAACMCRLEISLRFYLFSFTIRSRSMLFFIFILFLCRF